MSSLHDAYRAADEPAYMAFHARDYTSADPCASTYERRKPEMVRWFRRTGPRSLCGELVLVEGAGERAAVVCRWHFDAPHRNPAKKSFADEVLLFRKE